MSQQTKQIDYGARRWLFTTDREDDRANLFSKSMQSDDAWERLLKAETYLEITKNGMKDNDVNNEPIDFIVEAAHFHKQIDKGTGVGTGLGDADEAIEHYASVLMGNKDFTRPIGNRDEIVLVQGG